MVLFLVKNDLNGSKNEHETFFKLKNRLFKGINTLKSGIGSFPTNILRGEGWWWWWWAHLAQAFAN